MTYYPFLSDRQRRLKGASGYILQILREHAVDGVCTLSIDALSSLSGYCPASVKIATRKLIEAEIIRVKRQPPDRRNSYEVTYVSQTSA